MIGAFTRILKEIPKNVSLRNKKNTGWLKYNFTVMGAFTRILKIKLKKNEVLRIKKYWITVSIVIILSIILILKKGYFLSQNTNLFTLLTYP